MSSSNIEVDKVLISILRELEQPIDKAAIELIVLELYRLGKVSSGRAAAILHMTRKDFIQHASDLAIPYLRLTAEDLDSEVQTGRSLYRCQLSDFQLSQGSTRMQFGEAH